MALSADDAAYLAALKEARAKLLKGEMVTSVSSGGRTFSVNSPTLAELNAEIELYEAADASSDGKVRRRGRIVMR